MNYESKISFNSSLGAFEELIPALSGKRMIRERTKRWTLESIGSQEAKRFQIRTFASDFLLDLSSMTTMPMTRAIHRARREGGSIQVGAMNYYVNPAVVRQPAPMTPGGDCSTEITA